MINFYAVPIFDSNYVWFIVNESACEVYVVDPGHADPVLREIEEKSWHLKAILVTHSHHDHIGGIEQIKSVYDVPVYGPQSARIPQVTHVVKDEQSIELWDDLSANVISVPGHVPEHIAYFLHAASGTKPALFCGDAVFSSGCGRMFDGTPEQFHRSLEKVRNLPSDTELYCAHEYTLANLDFADFIEPESPALKAKRHDTLLRLDESGRSLPSTIAIERETNPFLRCHISAIQSRVNELTGEQPINTVATFAALRSLKDTF